MTGEQEVEVDKEPGAPTGALPEPSDGPEGPASGPEQSDSDEPNELRAFMDEYRADKAAAAAEREAKAKADAEAEAAKKRVPAPKPKPPKPAPKPEPEPKADPEPERGYGSSKWFNRKSKQAKNDG